MIRFKVEPAGRSRKRLLARGSLAMVAAAALIVPLAATAAPSSAAAASSVTSVTSVSATGSTSKSTKQRTIITSDGEIDDHESFVRALYYANEVDLEGIVLSSSKFHWAGDGSDVPEFNWAGTQWPLDYIADYAKIYPNLKKHAAGYPTPAKLRSFYEVGNIDNVGEMAEDTAGSDLIKKAILSRDPRKLFIQIWGGPNTTARALKSIQDQYEGDPGWKKLQRQISSKVVLYNILDQDPTLAEYIRPNWPDIKVIDNLDQFWSFGYYWRQRTPAAQASYLHGDFMQKNIVQGHGPLAARYITFGDGKDLTFLHHPGLEVITDPAQMKGLEGALGAPINQYDFISEGDSPSFMQLFDFNGLRSSTDPTWGGWGGRFDAISTGWSDASDVNPETGQLDQNYPQARWFSELQNDFATRADWGITPKYRNANHPPVAKVFGRLDRSVCPGRTVTLAGRANDPDGDRVTTKWWQYQEAGTYIGPVRVRKHGRAAVSVTVPRNAAPGQTIHMIFDAQDNGAHTLVSHQRVVITVGSQCR